MAALLSPKQLSEMPDKSVMEILKDLGPSVQWTKRQQRTLVKKLLCNNASLQDCWRPGSLMRPQQLVDLQSVAGGFPISMLKNPKNLLADKEGLKNMCMRMSKGQLMAVMQGVSQERQQELEAQFKYYHQLWQ